MYISYIKNNYLTNFSKNILAGLVTAIALLPEVSGFALIAGVPPLYAIFSSAITLVVLSIFGGRPAMVSAAAGSIALLLTDIIAKHGMAYMILATLLAGIIQLIFGLINVHKLIEYLPKSVMQGFVNALAIMILIAQLQQIPHQSLASIIMIVISIMSMYILPRWFIKIPPALIIMTISIVIAILFKGFFENIGTLANNSTINPHLGLPGIPLNLHTLFIILPTSLGIAVVGLIESLLTIPLIDDMTKTNSNSKQESIGQGIGNVITSLLGGQGGCAMIGQSVMNVQSGGRTRLSTLSSGIVLFVFVFVLKNLMLAIPTASLIGIMITVSIATFDWHSIALNKNIKIADLTVMILTVLVVVMTHNLAIGVFSGIILSIIYRYIFHIKVA
ncbi:SulP family inorganic anion transporter [Leuconostoc suionicum]|uniref:SulP family inorganic anion transporter n=1 Tax=Leuconostoc suionicum TaxID=1511761 RepID=UPI00233F0E83|nr:SulP family inorganic anion transporter [Leuconostoc suionicum]MDC2806224.1 SulP family inorganic anion transporter [Leuconostoc suionicum]MDC2823736.1 SulP family inorganic anion transporter [Leuconostoc suionicum]